MYLVIYLSNYFKKNKNNIMNNQERAPSTKEEEQEFEFIDSELIDKIG